MRNLRARGAAIVFTSHRWREVVSIADRITVFRNGRQVGTFTEIEEGEAVTLMAGASSRRSFRLCRRAPAGEPALEVVGLAGRGLSDVSLTLRKVEILGVGGLAGHGHRDLFFALFGAMKTTAGRRQCRRATGAATDAAGRDPGGPRHRPGARRSEDRGACR